MTIPEETTEMAITPSKPNRQQERTEKSTNALLEAAAELIAEGDFASMTFAAIGERAGYSRGLVTARFGSKDGLIEALIDRIVTTWNHRNVLPYTRGKSGIDGVSTVVDSIRRQAAGDRRGLRVLYSLMFEALGPDEALRTRFAKFHDGMRQDIARLVEKGRRDGSIVRSASPEREATLIVSGLRGIGYQWLLDPDGFDLVDALAMLHETTIARLRTADPAPTPARRRR